MKKLFISVPMKDRTEEQIKASMDKMHKIAEAVFGEELEVIDTYIDDPDYDGKRLECLGESIKRMQEADYFIGPDRAWEYNGCYIERETAYRYIGNDRMYIIEGRFIFSKEEIEVMEAREEVRLYADDNVVIDKDVTPLSSLYAEDADKDI